MGPNWDEVSIGSGGFLPDCINLLREQKSSTPYKETGDDECLWKAQLVDMMLPVLKKTDIFGHRTFMV